MTGDVSINLRLKIRVNTYIARYAKTGIDTMIDTRIKY